MGIRKFKTEEVKRNGHIDWDVVEDGSGHRFPVESPMVAGSYPEIERHLTQHYGLTLSAPLVCDHALGDRLANQT